MKISESSFRRILREEASREFSRAVKPQREFRLTVSEVRALKSLGNPILRLNEVSATDVAIAAAQSKQGRRIVISLLKAVKFITGLDVLLLRHLHSPMWQKVRDFIEDKVGINIPFSGDEFFNVLKWIAPGHYAGIVVDEAIDILDDMSDEEFSDEVKKNSKKNSSAKESKFKIGDKVRAKLSNPESSKQVWTVEGIIDSGDSVEYELRSGDGDRYSETTFPEEILMPAGNSGSGKENTRRPAKLVAKM